MSLPIRPLRLLPVGVQAYRTGFAPVETPRLFTAHDKVELMNKNDGGTKMQEISNDAGIKGLFKLHFLELGQGEFWIALNNHDE